MKSKMELKKILKHANVMALVLGLPSGPVGLLFGFCVYLIALFIVFEDTTNTKSFLNDVRFLLTI